MKKSILIVPLLAFGLFLGCKSDHKKPSEGSEPESTETVATPEKKEMDNNPVETKKIKVRLEPKSNSNVSGNVLFKETDGIVSMVAVFDGLSEGSHAIHLHEKADCSSEDGKSSGGHWNPTAQPHGKWGSNDGYHKGDIGNFTADAKGHGSITFNTDEWCIGCGDPSKDILGKAVIVHEGTDDFTSQPSGDAGTRVSCGGIIE
ncbi:superoxide dismutase family protein [Mangrovimonas sp. TPBH4]|uniref:superoxide dismutase family protein n=1 Tax=Mangrovimonas sp. TPBH4 TaxID=1645914 RepID=UPI0006B53F53|nr:superoxide dismutase family protein [Mangrovimonas sp. TPBH4]